jgi:hypothetical protein
MGGPVNWAVLFKRATAIPMTCLMALSRDDNRRLMLRQLAGSLEQAFSLRDQLLCLLLVNRLSVEGSGVIAVPLSARQAHRAPVRATMACSIARYTPSPPADPLVDAARASIANSLKAALTCLVNRRQSEQCLAVCAQGLGHRPIVQLLADRRLR